MCSMCTTVTVSNISCGRVTWWVMKIRKKRPLKVFCDQRIYRGSTKDHIVSYCILVDYWFIDHIVPTWLNCPLLVSWPLCCQGTWKCQTGFTAAVSTFTNSLPSFSCSVCRRRGIWLYYGIFLLSKSSLNGYGTGEKTKQNWALPQDFSPSGFTDGWSRQSRGIDLINWIRKKILDKENRGRDML